MVRGGITRKTILLCCCSAGALNQGARFPASLVTFPVNGERGGGRREEGGVAAKKFFTADVTKR